MFEQLAATLKKNRRTIVFTEGEDARILDAASWAGGCAPPWAPPFPGA